MGAHIVQLSTEDIVENLILLNWLKEEDGITYPGVRRT